MTSSRKKRKENKAYYTTNRAKILARRNAMYYENPERKSLRLGVATKYPEKKKQAATSRNSYQKDPVTKNQAARSSYQKNKRRVNNQE